MRVAVVGPPACPFAHEAHRLVTEGLASGAITAVVAPGSAGPAEAALLAARAAGLPAAAARSRDPARLADAADALWAFGDAAPWPLWFKGLGKPTVEHAGEPALLLFTAPHPRSRQARGGYRGPSALDVTRKSAPPEGLAFAPSEGLLREGLRRRAEADLAEADWDGPNPVADAIRAGAWAWYAPRFRAEMRRSWVESRAAWDALLARPLVVLLCYCPSREQCHRGVLAELVARAGEKLGRRVVDGGELTRASPRGPAPRPAPSP